MDYDMVDTFNIEEMTANYWRPIDYEVLNRKGRFDKWAYWMPIFYAVFVEMHRSVEWN